VVEQPWVFVVAVFIVAALTLSQSTTVAVVVPMGLATGLAPAMIVGSLPAVGGAVVLAGATGQAVAAVNFDQSGTTSLGAMLMDNSFVVPAAATVVPAVCCGFIISQLV
jgi:anaerobic C4-dicarboxylate transporter DcuB